MPDVPGALVELRRESVRGFALVTRSAQRPDPHVARTPTVSLRDGALAGRSSEVPEHLCRATFLLGGPTWITEHRGGRSTLGTGPVDPEVAIYGRLE